MADPLPRVLYAIKLVPGAQFGSLEEQMCMLSGKFNSDGSLFLLLFITQKSQGDCSDYANKGIPVERLDLMSFDIATLRELVALIKRHRIDIVQWNFINPLRNPYMWALSILCPRVRHWMTDHNSRTLPLAPPPRGLVRTLKRQLTKRYDVVVCVSQYVHDCLDSLMIWSKLLTQHHFINTERFAPADGVRRDMRRAENAGDKLIALFVGYLIPDKGVDIALRALAKAPSDICLWIVGGGPEQSKLEALVAELGLTDRVRMFGPQTNVQRYMQSADLLLCPSLWAEAAGLVNLEAQACGLPVVASRIGGIPEYVADERTGLLFEPGNSDDLSRQLRRIVDEPGLLRRLSSQARPWILDNFSPERRIPDVLNSYRTSGGNA